jgi:hypothetical protein
VNTHREQCFGAAGLRVRFTLEGDRHAHEVWLADGPNWVRVLSSVEGTPDDAWPPSPPFQSLQAETRSGGRQLALALGLAGKSHWSASIEFDLAAASAKVDVACRASAAPVSPLGSRYRIWQPLVSHDDEHAILGGAGTSPVRARLTLDQTIGPARLEIDHDTISIVPTITSRGLAPDTIRWGYTIASCQANRS